VSAAPREAMVSLLELLADVVSISEDAEALAAREGFEVGVAAIPEGADEPLGPLAPLPTPTAAPEGPTGGTIRARFFGSGLTLETYAVSGATPNEISTSMNRRGPYSAWLDGRAAATTEARVGYRFTFGTTSNGTCAISETGNPAILIRYTVTLPEWRSPAGVASSTVEWWNATVREIATHEKHHVDIYRDAQRDLNAALEKSTCANAETRLNAIWADVNREQCEFDMREYGYALGLSVEACLVG